MNRHLWNRRENDQQLDAQHVGHVGRRGILVDDGLNAVPYTLRPPHHRNSTTSAGDDYGAPAGEHLDLGNVADVLGPTWT